MSKSKLYHVGIDVSKKSLSVAIDKGDNVIRDGEFDNTSSGHKKLLRFITKGKPSEVKVCMEATGIYHQNLAACLSQQSSIFVMVVNPHAIKSFAAANHTRAKTDQVDAKTILTYVQRMPFKPWEAPSREKQEILALTHRINQLTDERAREKSRLTNNSFRSDGWKSIEKDMAQHIEQLTKRIDKLFTLLNKLIDKNDAYKKQKELLTSVKGIGEISAALIIAELANMPEDLTAPQLVAFAGLDPKPKESGSSMNKPRRISKAGNKRLRAALFMPAMSAIRHQDNVKAFYNMLTGKGKKKMQAIVAVMKKLLLCVYGMLKTGSTWDANKFYKIENIA